MKDIVCNNSLEFIKYIKTAIENKYELNHDESMFNFFAFSCPILDETYMIHFEDFKNPGIVSDGTWLFESFPIWITRDLEKVNRFLNLKAFI